MLLFDQANDDCMSAWWQLEQQIGTAKWKGRLKARLERQSLHGRKKLWGQQQPAESGCHHWSPPPLKPLPQLMLQLNTRPLTVWWYLQKKSVSFANELSCQHQKGDWITVYTCRIWGMLLGHAKAGWGRASTLLIASYDFSTSMAALCACCPQSSCSQPCPVKQPKFRCCYRR